MAGNYPDAPSWRMAYDRDGTQGYTINSANSIVQLTGAELANLNNEGDDYVAVAGTSTTATLLFVFPELRDLDGYFIRNNPSAFGAPALTVQTSVDTTNGIDGTWTTIGTPAGINATVKTAYRTGITSSTALAIRAVRFVGSTGAVSNFQPNAVHLYGEPAPGENPNRLALWHPTLDQRVTPAFFDWGNVPRNSSADRTFRVKNLSAVQTANSVRVAMEALTDTTPSVPGQHSISSDGSSFLAQVNIGALSPGAISGVLTLRRVIPSNAALSLWSFRIFAESTTWT